MEDNHIEDNPFRLLAKVRTKESIPEISKKAGLSKNTVAKIVGLVLPRQVQLETLDKLAGYFGYRVRVTLEKENES